MVALEIGKLIQPPPDRGLKWLGAVLGLVLLAGCTGKTQTAVEHPTRIEMEPWGPFARQCAEDRVSFLRDRPRLSPTSELETYSVCYGFSAMPAQNGAMVLTASMSGGTSSRTMTVLRLLRGPDGTDRPARPGDTGLLAQGSDDLDAAQSLARTIGVTQGVTISPVTIIDLPIRLNFPQTLDTVLSCQPDGGGQINHRGTLVLSCHAQQTVHSDQIDGDLVLAGVEEVDIATGVRLASRLSGHLRGARRTSTRTAWQKGDYRLFYSRNTEFD